MSGRTMEFGIRISADGKVAVPEINKVDAAIDKVGTTAKDTSAKIDGVTAATKRIGETAPALRPAQEQLDKVGLSAKQTAAALRGVPAQFTDIFTQLAAGQNPMQIFIQQGGQLKDMFGGAGPAARALAGYVGGLVNPTTIAAAAVGGLAFAYYQGSKEADAYTKAIVMSGNAAGVTSGQMATMAANIDRTVGTQAKAAETLALMASTGKVAGDNLERFSQIAIEMERAVGQPVAETVKQFDALGQSPVAASLKLNESLRFLTEATFKQIKAAEELGDKEAAAAIAQEAYAAAMKERAGKITQNLGYIESAWVGVKDAAKDAWDAILGIGRSADPAEKAQAAVEAIKARIADIKKNAGYDPYGAQGELVRLNAELKAAENRLAIEQKIAAAKSGAAQNEAQRQRQDQAGIQLAIKGEQYLTKQQKLEREIAETRALGVTAKWTEAQLEERIGQIREKYRDKTEKKSRNIDDAAVKQAKEYEALYLAALKYSDQLEIQAGRVDKVTKGEELAALVKKKLNAAQALAIQPLLEQIDALERAAIAQAAYNAYVAAQIEPLEKQARTMEASNETYGMTEAQIQRLATTRLDDAVAILEQAKAKAQAAGADHAEIDRIQQSIDLYQREAEARGRIANAADVRRQRDMQVDMWRSTEQAAHSTWNEISRDGANAMEIIGRSLKTAVWDLLYQLTLKQWIVNISASMSGSGVAGAAFPNSGTMPGGGFGGANAFSLMNAFNSGNAAFNAGYTAVAGSSAGQWLGLSNTSSFVGPLAPGQTAQLGLTSLGQGVQSALPYLPALYSLSQGQYGAAAGSAIGAFVGGPVGAAIGGMLGGMLDGGGDDPHNNPQISGINGITLARGGATGGASFVAGPTSGSGWWGESTQLSSAQIAEINKQVAAAFASGANLAALLGIDAAVLDGVSVSSSSAGTTNGKVAKYFASVEEAIAALGAAMADKLLPAVRHLALDGETAAQTLARVATAMQARDQLESAIGISIEILNGSLTEYEANLQAANAGIMAMQEAVANTTDVQKSVDMEGQLYQAVQSRYALELQYLAQLRGTVQSAMSELASVQAGSVSAREHIVGPSILSAADLRTRIASATEGLGLPSLDGVTDAETNVAAGQLALTLANAYAAAQANAQSGYDDLLDEVATDRAARDAAVKALGTRQTGTLSTEDVTQGKASAWSYYTYFKSQESKIGPVRDAQKEYAASVADAYAAYLTLQTSITDALANSVDVAQASLTDSQDALTAAKQSLADALTAYAGDATKAADTLGQLRDETLRYYDAQAQLADLMHNSSAALGSTVTGLLRSNMTGVDQSVDILAEFRSLYEGASTLEGAALAGRADQINSLASAAIQSAQAAWASGPEFQSILSEITGDLSALQGRLDDSAPKDYQAEALSLLSGIDLSLSQLEDGLASADSMVVDAINGSRDATVDMLTQIRDKLDRLITVSDTAAQALN